LFLEFTKAESRTLLPRARYSVANAAPFANQR
jgi:hypothetical protein